MMKSTTILAIRDRPAARLKRPLRFYIDSLSVAA